MGIPRRGRPKGSTNRRSGDLQSILVATYQGRTPGQQLAAICLPTSKELKEAKARVRLAGGAASVDLVAQVIKAENLAKAMGWTDGATGRVTPSGLRDAWAMIFKAYQELLPYVHQRLAPKEGEKGAAQLPMILMDPEPAGGAALPSSFGDVEEDQPLIEVLPLQLSRPNSHD